MHSLDAIQTALRAHLRERLTASLHEFVKYFWSCIDGAPFMDNWHIKAVCDHLQACSDGRIKRLMIMLPPRHAKSIVVNVFYPVWDWLHTPHRRFLTAGVNQSLGHGFMNKSRSLIESDRFQWVFGDKVEPSKKAWGASFYMNTQKGSRLAMTTSGGTGKDADILICDDPMEDAKAWSEVERNRVWEWYTGTFKMRGTSEDAAEILVMQRLHEDDLVGRILERPKLRNRYDILCFPAEYESWHPVKTVSSIGFEDPRKEEGELLWPARFSKAWIDERNESASKQKLAAQLQQRPAPADGLVFKETMFPLDERPFEAIALKGFERVVLSVDCTFKEGIGTDYVAMLAFGRQAGRWYCLGGINKQMDFVDTLKAIASLVGEYAVTELLIEDKANGPAVIRVLRDKLDNVVPIRPKESKESRANAASEILSNGNVLFLDKVPLCHVLIEQCLHFPMAKHDDLVDALTQFVNHVLNRSQNVVKFDDFGGFHV